MNIVIIGAHPDDCEVYAGGAAVKWSRAGHGVTFVSMTNGDKGHHEQRGTELAARRRDEARLSAQRAQVNSRVLEYPDGELEPTLGVRCEVVRLLRRLQADVVITHRPHDYHPDHRYTSIVVQDCAFMVTVPAFCPDVPALRPNPIFFYMMDRFVKSTPFTPDFVVDVDDVMDVKWSMLDAMESQFYEWLPWIEGMDPPSSDRSAWLREAWSPFLEFFTGQFRPELARHYDQVRAESVQFAEAFQLCEYGTHPEEGVLNELFSFQPVKG